LTRPGEQSLGGRDEKQTHTAEIGCGWAEDKAPNQTVTTHWLLTISRLSKEDEWSNTTTGCDTFEKVLDNPEEKYLSAERQELEQLLAKSRIRAD
jgi:hypothetical protein